MKFIMERMDFLVICSSLLLFIWRLCVWSFDRGSDEGPSMICILQIDRQNTIDYFLNMDFKILIQLIFGNPEGLLTDKIAWQSDYIFHSGVM